jgi:hypothetical protein
MEAARMSKNLKSSRAPAPKVDLDQTLGRDALAVRLSELSFQISGSTLAAHASDGTGPPFVMAKGPGGQWRAVYVLRDGLSWIQARRNKAPAEVAEVKPARRPTRAA